MAGEPWKKSKEEILKLDRWWVTNILFWPRQKNGELVVRRKSNKKQMTPREIFDRDILNRGVSWWKAELLWVANSNANRTKSNG